MDEYTIYVGHNYLKKYRERREFASSQEKKALQLFSILFEREASMEELKCAFAWLNYSPAISVEKIIELVFTADEEERENCRA